MTRTGYPVDLGPEMLLRGGALTAAVRRDLTDLNRQFLDLGLAPEFASDPRFAWSETVRSGLLETDSATRDRMAECPFALFAIALPGPQSGPGAAVSRVEDATGPVGREPWHGRCVAFAQSALSVASRLADTVPLATRVALGLPSGAELLLAEMRPSEMTQLARCPGLIHPRWPGHQRFWATLCSAARADSASSLRRAHCLGIRLLGADLSDLALGPCATVLPRYRPPR
jgi:hypothetical protein